MNTIPQLWLPILATAALIFIASSLIHMVFKWHNADYRKLTNEDAVRDAVRAGTPAPGQYVLPHCLDMKDMQGEAMQKKFMEGPIAFLTVKKNGPPAMGMCLAQWFVYCLVISAISGGLAMCSVGAGQAQSAAYLVGAISFLAYVGGSVQMGIWMGKPWRSVALEALDGLIYAAIGACVFMWLWPVK